MALVLAGLIGVAVLAAVLVALLGGGGGKGSPTTVATSSNPPAPPSTPAPTTSSPGVLRVAVLNGTSVNGLAHRLADSLHAHGYGRASALNGRPATAASTTVFYAGGHRADARRVARAVGVSSVAPMNAATAALAPGTSLVVVAGNDQSGQGGAANGAAAPGSNGGGAATTGTGAAGGGAAASP